MASTLPVWNDTQGFTGTLQYVELGEAGSGSSSVVGWFGVADLDALRALPALSTNVYAVVSDINGYGAGTYRWDNDSTEDEDVAAIIAPATGDGRWKRL